MNEKKTDILAFAPHPDDIEMGCGGTMIKLNKLGYVTGIIEMTRGELGTRGTPDIRKLESIKAAEILGVKYKENLDLGDGTLENNRTNKELVVDIIRKYRPKLVIAPHWFDDHPDHIECANLVKESVYLAGLANYLPKNEYHRTGGIIYYMCRGEFNPKFVIDISDVFNEKLRAIQSYSSQFHSEESDEPETSLSDPDFIKIFEARGRVYGRMIGCRYGEPFDSKYPPNILDPVAAL
ncbi:bacillithiol biosynthesis deacetylase BshB1 [candidate division KSB1 bacterium]